MGSGIERGPLACTERGGGVMVLRVAALVCFVLAVLGLMAILFTLTIGHALALIAAGLLLWLLSTIAPVGP